MTRAFCHRPDRQKAFSKCLQRKVCATWHCCALSLYQHLSVTVAGIKKATELPVLGPNHNKQTDFNTRARPGGWQWLSEGRGHLLPSSSLELSTLNTTPWPKLDSCVLCISLNPLMNAEKQTKQLNKATLKVCFQLPRTTGGWKALAQPHTAAPKMVWPGVSRQTSPCEEGAFLSCSKMDSSV